MATSIAENIDTVTTTSQPLAEAMGATPQQVAMTGTQPHKQSLISDRIDSASAQKQELGRTQRIEAPLREMTVAEAESAEKQEQLAKLGGLGLSIQNRINQSLSQAAEASTGQVGTQTPLLASTLGLTNPDMVNVAKADPNSNYNKAKSALENFMAGGDLSNEAALAAIDNLKIHGFSAANARQLIGVTQEQIAKTTGQTLATNVMDQVTIGDLDLQSLGFDQTTEELATLLNVDPQELAGYTVDQLGDAVENTQQAEFANVEKLKAELAATPMGSSRREELMRELKDMGEAGITGVESEIVETIEDIDMAGQVKIGDSYMKVEDFLDDENLSELVMDYINETDPLEKSKLISSEDHPELVAWVEANQQALAELSTTSGETVTKFNEANDTYKSMNTLGKDFDNMPLTSDMMAAYMPGYDPERKVSSSELADIQAAFSATPLGTLIAGGIDNKSIVSDMNTLSPEDLEATKSMSANDLKIAHKASEELQANPILADFLGIDPGKFTFSEIDQDRAAEYLPVLNSINEVDPTILQDPASKNLSIEQLKQISNNPTGFKYYKDTLNTQDKLDKLDNVEDAFRILINNDSASFTDIEEQYQNAKKWSDLGDPNAKEKMDSILNLLGVEGQPESLFDSSARIIAKINNDFNGDINSALGGNDPMSGMKSNSNDWLKATTSTQLSNDYQKFADVLEKPIVSFFDFQGRSPEEQARLQDILDNNPNIQVNFEGFPTFKEYDDNIAQGKFIGSADIMSQNLGFGTLDEFSNWQEKLDAGEFEYRVEDMDRLDTFADRISVDMTNTSDNRIKNYYKGLLDELTKSKILIENRLGNKLTFEDQFITR